MIVNSAIQQLNQVIQQNAAAAEEMATSSKELSAQAIQLKDTISFFKMETHLKADTVNKSKHSLQRITLKHKAIEIPYLAKTYGMNQKAASGGVTLHMNEDSLDEEYEKY